MTESSSTAELDPNEKALTRTDTPPIKDLTAAVVERVFGYIGPLGGWCVPEAASEAELIPAFMEKLTRDREKCAKFDVEYLFEIEWQNFTPEAHILMQWNALTGIPYCELPRHWDVDGIRKFIDDKITPYIQAKGDKVPPLHSRDLRAIAAILRVDARQRFDQVPSGFYREDGTPNGPVVGTNEELGYAIHPRGGVSSARLRQVLSQARKAQKVYYLSSESGGNKMYLPRGSSRTVEGCQRRIEEYREAKRQKRAKHA